MADIFSGCILAFAAGIAQWSGVEHFGESLGLKGPPYALMNPLMFVAAGFLIGKGVFS